jgi:lipopolysaccharide transport system ATP-binding protein
MKRVAMPIITVSKLSKSYSIRHRLERNAHPTLRDDLALIARKPLEWIGAAGGSKREEFWALNDINFKVDKGDVVGIMGKNGSGKSTLFKILSRVTEPTTGRIEINGDTASLLEVGTGFHPELTGRENVYFNGAILGMSKVQIDQRFDDIVGFAEVDKFLDTPVKFYSSGMKVRLAFSVAAFLDPEVLIIDEVLAVGDVQFKKKSLEHMKKIARSDGKTILFVSHIVGQVQEICTRGIVLNNGEMVHDGSLNDAIDTYLDLNDTREDVGDEGLNLTKKNDNYQGKDIGFKDLITKVENVGGFPKLNIGISLVNLSGLHHKNLRLNFIIVDQLGKNVSNIVSDQKISDLVIEKSSLERRLSFQIANLNLVPDKYTLTMSLVDANDYSQVYFRKYDAHSFIVPEYSFGGVDYKKSRGTTPPVVFDFEID